MSMTMKSLKKLNFLRMNICSVPCIRFLTSIQNFFLEINEEKYDNLAEFVLDNFNKIPGKNENFIFENKAEFSIANISSQRIKSIRLKLLNHTIEN